MDYLLNNMFLIDRDENVEYDNSTLNIVYVGLEDFTIELRVDNQHRLWLDLWRSGEASGEIYKLLKKLIRELVKCKLIFMDTRFCLVAQDINCKNGLDNLVRYYDRLGFIYDPVLDSRDPETTFMSCYVKTFLSTKGTL